MTSTRRTFISVGLAPALLRRLDRQVERRTFSRSALVRIALERLLPTLEDDSDRLDDSILAERGTA